MDVDEDHEAEQSEDDGDVEGQGGAQPLDNLSSLREKGEQAAGPRVSRDIRVCDEVGDGPHAEVLACHVEDHADDEGAACLVAGEPSAGVLGARLLKDRDHATEPSPFGEAAH